VILAVFRRNFSSYFSGVIGYLFIVAFVGASAYLAFRPQFFANNLANLDELNEWFPWLLLFIVPAITMSSWAEERKQGTDELLFTLPATDFEILLGKYLSVLAIYTVALLFSMLFCGFGVMTILTTTAQGGFADFDKGLIVTNYLGYWLSGAALLSAGMVASILTSNATVAFIVGAALCAVPVFIGSVAPSNRLLQSLSVSEQLRDFGLGMIPISGILYFASFVAFMLYLNLVLISKRHWSGGPHGTPMGLHLLARGVSLAIVLVCFNVVAANASTRLDLTSERLYSVFPTTRKVITEIKPERPVLIQAFISPQVPSNYVATRSNLIGLLRQYDQIGGDRLKVRIVETEQFSDAADEAKKFGIQPRQIQTERGGKVFVESVFLGAVVSSGSDDEVVVPFFDLGTPVEYELTRSVRTVAGNKRLKVGILTSDAKLFGGFDPATFSSTPEWRIISELKKQYAVEQVPADGPITGSFDVLIAAMPSSLTEPQLTNLVDYVKRGRPTLIFDDPLPVFSPGLSLAPRQPKPSPGGGMFGHNQPPVPKADNGKATRLLNELGIAWDNGETVWDGYNPHPEFADVVRPEVVFVSARSGGKSPFGSRSPISSGLQEVLLLFSGQIMPRQGAEGLEFIPLLRTSPESGVIPWDDLVGQSMSMFGMGGLRLKNDPPRLEDGVEHVLAARVTSKQSKDQSAGVNVVFVADLDMISDTMFDFRDRELYGLKLDNVTFVLNAVDTLAGDESLVELRKRRARHHTLSRVELLTETARNASTEATRKADAEAKKELEEAKSRFKEAREKIEKDTSLDPNTKRVRLGIIQEEEQRRLTVSEANIENAKQKKIEQAKASSQREIRKVEGTIQTLAVILPMVPVVLVGMFVFFGRLAAERRTIIPERMVKR
jgi:ABC-2 type transport system permease protein